MNFTEESIAGAAVGACASSRKPMHALRGALGVRSRPALARIAAYRGAFFDTAR